jgi:hypothetical protein
MKKDVIEIDLNYTLNELKVTPTQWLLMYTIHNKDKERFEELRELYLDECFKEDLHSLMLKGYVFGGNKENKFSFTFEKSQINGIFTDQNETSESLSWDDFISQFRDTFPSGVKSGGFYVKSSKKDIEVKLKKFVKDYKFSQETILKAVKSYVKESSQNNYQYMKIAHYFILKNGESMLAGYCDAIEEGTETESVPSIFINKL